MKEEIKVLAKKYLDEIIGMRREFHRHPELAFEEIETALRITKFLDAHKIKYTEKDAKTGIVGVIEGRNPESTFPKEFRSLNTIPSQVSKALESAGPPTKQLKKTKPPKPERKKLHKKNKSIPGPFNL